MIDIYMAGHGEYPAGLVSALEMLLGDSHGITPICAYTGDITSIHHLEERLQQAAEEALARGHQMVLFTDIPGGSVNNTAMKIALNAPHVHVISGAGVVTLMEFYMAEEAPLAERIDICQQATHGAIRYVNAQPDFIALRDALAARAAAGSDAS